MSDETSDILSIEVRHVFCLKYEQRAGEDIDTNTY